MALRNKRRKNMFFSVDEKKNLLNETNCDIYTTIHIWESDKENDTVSKDESNKWKEI